MTLPYSWYQMPDKLDVNCPQCGQLAQFEFAEVRRIKHKTDVDFFKNSTIFEYQQFQDSCGHYWHGARYFPGLHGNVLTAIHDLPTGYKLSDWGHSYSRSGQDIGSVRCEHCHFRDKHRLNWPTDAYFSISYRNNVLWAFNRESACVLRDYLLSTSRQRSRYRYSTFLLHIPTVFKTQKARTTVSKRLMALLTKDSHSQTGRANR